MKINRVHIENYKSIKNLEFKPSPKMNVFIGENSVGKSNIIEAIYWLLGPVFPTFNKTTMQDHYLGKVQNKISITLSFDDSSVLRLAENWKDYGGREKHGLSCNNAYINAEERQKYCSAYLDIRRNIVDYLPSNRWSLLGRFLLDVNDRFIHEKTSISGQEEYKSEKLKRDLTQIRDELLFSVVDEEGTKILPEFLKHVSSECAKQLNRDPEEFKLDLNIYDPWNFYKTLQILVTDPECGLDFQSSSMGMGMQAALSIAILKAYSKLKLANNTPIFIDEPELFLHPQAQRNFYNILNDLAESGTQIFLTTHSPAFINLAHFDQIFLVRKNKDKGTYLCNANPDDFVTDLKKRHGINTYTDRLMEEYAYAYDNTGDTQKANEAFFSKKIILVEGASEVLIIPYFFKLLGFDYIAENISIVQCGGKSEIDRFYRLYSEFGIPCFIIFDGDAQHTSEKQRKEDIRKNKAILELVDSTLVDSTLDYSLGSVHDKYLGFRTCLEDNLGLSESPSSSDKGLKLYQLVKKQIRNQDDVPQWVTEIIEKLSCLPENVPSVLWK